MSHPGGQHGRDYEVTRATWQTRASASAYRAKRGPAAYGRYTREDRIARAWLGDLGTGARILDVPCGTGRFIELANELELAYVGADISAAMLHEAGRGSSGRRQSFVLGDVTRLPFRDASFDCVIVWRILHHIGDTATRQAILREAARVTTDRILVSFHHTLSFTALRKAVQRACAGRAMRGKTITHWTLEREARACGLVLLGTRSFRKYSSINWFACLRKGAPP
jgi:SAM-dependent methyltransferase